MSTQQNPPGAPVKGVLRIKTGVTRDGTLGISILLGNRLVGEWTDSRARSLALGDDLKVKVLDAAGETLYMFIVPGKVLSGEVISDREVAVTFET